MASSYGVMPNLNKIQTFQNLVLRKLLNAPPYVSNCTIHSDLQMKTVQEEAKAHYMRFHNRLYSNCNPLIHDLAVPTFPGNPLRRLKRKWCRDLFIPPSKFKIKKKIYIFIVSVIDGWLLTSRVSCKYICLCFMFYVLDVLM